MADVTAAGFVNGAVNILPSGDTLTDGGGVRLIPTHTPSATAPTSPTPINHDTWWNTVDDVLTEYTNDGTSSFWITVSNVSTNTSETITPTVGIGVMGIGSTFTIG